ncbi:hypothetical protein GCM10025792_24010 [Pseudonocardia tropica]
MPNFSRWSLLAAAGLFAAGTGVTIGASLLRHSGDFHRDTLYVEIGALVGRIGNWLLTGLTLAGLGVVVLLAGASVDLLEPADPVRVHLSEAGRAKVERVCPSLSGEALQATRVDSLKGTDPLVSIDLPANACAPESSETSLTILRSDISVAQEQ